MKGRIGEGKTILLGMPNWFLFNQFKNHLEGMGFKVIDISFTNKFKYRSWFDRTISFIHKNILGNKGYKAKLNFRDTGKHIRETVESLKEPVDYCLLIRSDYYSIDFIKLLKQKSNKIIGYQWDGLNRFPWVKERIELFDRFFVFDPEDLTFPSVLPITNFYFNAYSDLGVIQELDVYYLGIFVRNRIPNLIALGNQLKKLGYKSLLKIISDKDKLIKKHDNDVISIQSDYITYEENIQLVNRTRILVDFLHNAHSGLSFRVFEAIGNQKKIITDNLEVVKYEFYDPANFYIVKDKNFEGLQEFIDTPYKPLPSEIIEKYSFDNWIRYVLDLKPYQKINLPD